MLADDNADMRDYVRKLLARRYDVEAVADGEAALKAIARVKPDLVLSDIMMPRLDGMQLLARLRANHETSTLPIILLSARAGEESSVEGMQAGADDYLIKPFSARELLARVEAHVKIARLRRDSEQALRDEQERWNLAAHGGRFGQWRLDLVTNAADLSTGCKANFGLGPEEEASAERIFTLIHPDDSEQVTARLRQAIAERNAFEVEYRVIWPDGSLHWINARGTASYAPDGTPLKMVGVALEITERKRVEEHMRMLVAELDHRVKNTLATVSAMVSHTLQARQSVPDFAAALEGRLRSMAATHELLSAHRWQGVSLSELVRRELAPYAARNNSEAGGPEVVLRAEAGQGARLRQRRAQQRLESPPRGLARAWRDERERCDLARGQLLHHPSGERERLEDAGVALDKAEHRARLARVGERAHAHAARARSCPLDEGAPACALGQCREQRGLGILRHHDQYGVERCGEALAQARAARDFKGLWRGQHRHRSTAAAARCVRARLLDRRQ